MKFVLALLMTVISFQTFAVDADPTGYGTTGLKRCSSVTLEQNAPLQSSQFLNLVPANVTKLTYLEMCVVKGINKACIWETYDLVQNSQGLFQSWGPHLHRFQRELALKDQFHNPDANFEVCLNQ